MARSTTKGLVSGYEIAKTLNAKLEATTPAGETAKVVQPQMVYQYIRSGRIPSQEVDDGKGGTTKMVKEADAVAWIKSYLAGDTPNGRKSTDENVKRLLEQL